jgi:hypothetical protein
MPPSDSIRNLRAIIQSGSPPSERQTHTTNIDPFFIAADRGLDFKAV